MKTGSTRLFARHFTILFLFSLLLGACTPDTGADDNSFRVRATGSGANERPNPVNTPATGMLTGNYFNISNQFTFTLSWNGLTGAPVAMHFHGPAGPEEVAPPVVGIMNFLATPTGTITQTITLTPEQEQQLLQGKWYFNIHTPTYPAGEIRGQLQAGR